MARTRHGGAGGAGGRMPWRLLALHVATLAAGAARLPAQEHAVHPARAWAVGARAVPVATHAAPVLYGRPATELYVTQPSLMGHLGLAGGRLRLAGTLSLEGLTLRRGELNPGIWGKGTWTGATPTPTFTRWWRPRRFPPARARPRPSASRWARGSSPSGPTTP